MIKNEALQTLPRFLFFFIKKHYLLSLLFFLLPICIILESNVVPYSFRIIIDTLVKNFSNRNNIMQEIFPSFILFVLAHICFLIIMRFQKYLEAITIPHIEADMRTSLMNYIMRNDYEYFLSQSNRNIVNKILELPQSIEQIRAIVCWNIIPGIAVVSCTILMTLSINYTCSLIICLWTIVHVILSLYFAKIISEFSRINAKERWKVSSAINDILSNIITVKLSNCYIDEISYIKNVQSDEQKSNNKVMQMTNYLQLLIDIPATIMLMSILYFLVNGWKVGNISTGECVFVINITFSVMYQLWSVGNIFINLSRQLGTAQQALSLIFSDSLNQKTISYSNSAKVNIKEIKFTNVNFIYPNGKEIFKNLNITIHKKEKIGIVGLSGSGKSTFLSLILGLFDVSSGNISINAKNIESYDKEVLYNNMAVISSSTTLFNRSIYENIKYGKSSATHKEIINIAKKIGAHEFIMNLPEGYNTCIGEKSIQLSSGQIQKILIARILLRDSKFILLDEPTSSLDATSEKLVNKALFNSIKNKTAIIIDHRLYNMVNMDRILVFKNGKIIEDGTHSKLIKSGGSYATMWKAQNKERF